MDPLILLSHGSRHPRAHEGIDALVQQTAATLGGRVLVVDAHLDFSPHTLAAVASQLAAEGWQRAVVVPLLFSAGYHARVDVPAEVEQASSSAGIELKLARPLGAGDDIADILVTAALRDNPAARELVIYPVGSSSPAAVEDYDALVGRVRAMSRLPTRWHPATRADIPLAEVDTHRGHIIPLFVTHGLLLDKALDDLPPNTTISGPLADDLAGVAAARYRQAVTP